MVAQHSHELHHNEIQDFIDRGKTKQLLLKLWEFAGCYPLWPKALLGRTDITVKLRDTLQLHLSQMNGFGDTTPFQKLAESLGVDLPDPAPQGWLISSAVISADNTSLPEALGKYFANECLPNWPALARSLANIPDIDLNFFTRNPRPENYYHELAHNQDKGVFTEAAQAYAIQRTIYMNQIRALI